MSPSSWVFGYRLALGGVLLVLSCQHEPQAIFDGSEPPAASGGSSSGASGSGAAGSEDAPGAGGFEAAGAPSGGDGKDGGSSTTGGQAPAAGAGGSPSAGGTSEAGRGGSGGAGASGVAGSGTAGGSVGGGSGDGGTGNIAGAGIGGSKPLPEPEPMTIEIKDFADTHVAACYESGNYGSAELLSIDGDHCSYQALLSPSLMTIPAGAEVLEATLTLFCENVGGQLDVAYVEEAWKEDTVRYSTRPEVGATIGQLTCEEVGVVSFDLTAAVKAWHSGSHAPHGVYLRSEDENGTDFVSSEGDDSASRPRLRVTFLPSKK